VPLFAARAQAAITFSTTSDRSSCPGLSQRWWLIILGYALLYWPHLPAGFNVDEKAQSAQGIEALYFSGITFTTLGYGDIAPRSTRCVFWPVKPSPALAS
jgi:Ion channel